MEALKTPNSQSNLEKKKKKKEKKMELDESSFLSSDTLFYFQGSCLLSFSPISLQLFRLFCKLHPLPIMKNFELFPLYLYTFLFPKRVLNYYDFVSSVCLQHGIFFLISNQTCFGKFQAHIIILSTQQLLLNISHKYQSLSSLQINSFSFFSFFLTH